MKIILNGVDHILEETQGAETQTAETLNITMLVSQLGLEGEKIAVECNLEIIARSAWGAHKIKEGDRIEIINFVGGGK